VAEPDPSIKAFGMPDRPQHMVTISAIDEGNIFEDGLPE
jgi:hypothetical protein